MKTLQQWLEEDNTRFLQRLEGRKEQEVQSICEEELHRILSQYNDQAISDTRRQNAQYFLEMIHLSLPYLDSIGEIKLYERSLYGKTDAASLAKKKVFGGIAFFLVGLVTIVLFTGAWIHIWLTVFGAVCGCTAMWLCYSAGKGGNQQNASDIQTDVQVDVKKIYHVLSAQLTRCDAILQEMERLEISAQKTQGETVDPQLIRFFCELLETAYTEKDNSICQEMISQAEYYLHLLNIEAVSDVEGHPEYFDLMPGKQGMMRPAFVQGQKVLQRGLAAGVRK